MPRAAARCAVSRCAVSRCAWAPPAVQGLCPVSSAPGDCATLLQLPYKSPQLGGRPDCKSAADGGACCSWCGCSQLQPHNQWHRRRFVVGSDEKNMFAGAVSLWRGESNRCLYVPLCQQKQ